MVPNGWELKELKELVTFSNGKGHEKHISETGKYAVVNSKFISSDGRVVKFSDEVFCPACKDDILMVMSDVPNGKAIAKCFLVNENEKYTVNQRIARFTSKGSEPLFLFYTINRNSYYLQFDDGLKQTNLRKDDVLACPIKTPPLSEQRKIAKILSTWDKAISTTERLINNSKQQKKALMQQLLTGKKRLLDDSGKPFEGEWEYRSIEEISTRIQRKSDGEVHPILTISSLSGFVTQEERYSRYMAGESVKKYILLKEGEFAYNKGNSKTYQFGCVFDLEGFKTGLVPHVYVCFKLNSNFSHRYFKYLFEADYLKPQLGALVNTGVRNNGLLNIKPSAFLNTKVPVPSFIEQEKIANVFHAVTQNLKNLEHQLAHLKQEKKALMQQLLTGKRRVKVDDKEVA